MKKFHKYMNELTELIKDCLVRRTCKTQFNKGPSFVVVVVQSLSCV